MKSSDEAAGVLHQHYVVSLAGEAGRVEVPLLGVLSGEGATWMIIERIEKLDF